MYEIMHAIIIYAITDTVVWPIMYKHVLNPNLIYGPIFIFNVKLRVTGLHGVNDISQPYTCITFALVKK